MNDAYKMREAFQALFALPPYEWSFKIHGDESAWAGNYYGYHIQCAWEGYQAATAQQNERIKDLEAQIEHQRAILSTKQL